MSKKITSVDASRFSFNIHRDLSVSTRARMPGAPERIDGLTVGFLTITHDAPDGGEIHPDGHEILIVISGRLRVTGESEPDAPLELGPADACIVDNGESHRRCVPQPAHP